MVFLGFSWFYCFSWFLNWLCDGCPHLLFFMVSQSAFSWFLNRFYCFPWFFLIGIKNWR